MRRPCVATLHRVFKALDVHAFEAALGQWLSTTGVAGTEPIAVDGKTLRGIHGEALPGVHLVAAYTHHAGAILGQLQTAGKGQEIAAAQELLAQVPLAGRLVTTDALLTQREVATQIVAGGGDYLLPVKDHQPSRRADTSANHFNDDARCPRRPASSTIRARPITPPSCSKEPVCARTRAADSPSWP